jgi:circadian clock protein KaiC
MPSREVERLPSGSERLDRILHGGLPANAINLVIGPPGTGKTIFADQYVFHNATEERPALYYSTLSEPHDKLLRYGQSLDIFDSDAVGRSVFYEPLGPVVLAGGLDAVTQRIAEDIKARRPGVIVIDSFRALASYADAREFRTFLSALADSLTAFPVSAIWVGEYTPDDLARAPEFAVADAVVSLSREDRGVREFRFLQVLKLRGSGFMSGMHALRLTAQGIDVFPRLADAGDATAYPTGNVRTSSGIDAIDALTGEGFLVGSATLVAGPSGVGKTLMGLHWAFAGARAGEQVMIASFQENPSQLEHILAGFGWSLHEDGVHLFYRSAVDLYIDEWMSLLLEQIEQLGVRRVLVDSISDLEPVAADRMRFREFAYSFIQRCTRAGVSVMFTMELGDLFEVRRLGQNAQSHLADNVVLLQYVLDGPTIRRALTVLKSRGTRHDPGIYEYDITSDGVVLGDPISNPVGKPGPRPEV